MSSAATEHTLVATKFGGWYDGDNHKPGRGFYFVCSCGKIGLGQLLPASAHRQFRKHADRMRYRSQSPDDWTQTEPFDD